MSLSLLGKRTLGNGLSPSVLGKLQRECMTAQLPVIPVLFKRDVHVPRRRARNIGTPKPRGPGHTKNGKLMISLGNQGKLEEL